MADEPEIQRIARLTPLAETLARIDALVQPVAPRHVAVTSALRQVLTPQNFERIVPGMLMEPVRKMLGKPMKITPYSLKQETHYDWRYLGDPNTSRIFTAVLDADLRVIRTGSVDDIKAESGGGNR